MMRHARPPVNKRVKLRTTTPLGGSARPSEHSRRFVYTACGVPSAAPCRALHQVFTYDVNCVHARIPPTRPRPRLKCICPRQSSRQGTIEVAMTTLTDLLP